MWKTHPPVFHSVFGEWPTIYNLQEFGDALYTSGNIYDLQTRYDLMYNKILSFITLHELKRPETISKKIHIIGTKFSRT